MPKEDEAGWAALSQMTLHLQFVDSARTFVGASDNFHVKQSSGSNRASLHICDEALRSVWKSRTEEDSFCHQETVLSFSQFRMIENDPFLWSLVLNLSSLVVIFANQF